MLEHKLRKGDRGTRNRKHGARHWHCSSWHRSSWHRSSWDGGTRPVPHWGCHRHRSSTFRWDRHGPHGRWHKRCSRRSTHGERSRSRADRAVTPAVDPWWGPSKLLHCIPILQCSCSYKGRHVRCHEALLWCYSRYSAVGNAPGDGASRGVDGGVHIASCDGADGGHRWAQKGAGNEATTGRKRITPPGGRKRSFGTCECQPVMQTNSLTHAHGF